MYLVYKIEGTRR